MKSLVLFMIYLVLSSSMISISTKPLQNSKTDEPVIGIDFGTTYSCVGVYRNGKVEIIPNELGNRVTPSIVAFTGNGRKLIGEEAKSQAIINTSGTIISVKRLLGKKFLDKEVQLDKKILRYEIVKREGKPFIQVNIKGKNNIYSPEVITAEILTKMKQIAEKYLGKPVKNAVITVPAYFNDNQTDSIKEAAKISGLNVQGVINGPTAAAIAYGLDTDKRDWDRNILVLDMGGETLEISLLNFRSGAPKVLASDVDDRLGGDDFNRTLLAHFISLVKKNLNVNVSGNRVAIQKLIKEIGKVKRTLSTKIEANVEIIKLVKELDFTTKFTRAKFERLIDDFFEMIVNLLEKVMTAGKRNKKDIDEIVLVGGSTNIPKIQNLIKNYFNGKELVKGINPDEIGAYGAAIQGNRKPTRRSF